MAPLSAPHQGRAIGVLSAEILFLILPWILVGLRLWARRLKKTPLVFNDYAIILASVFALSQVACVLRIILSMSLGFYYGIQCQLNDR